MNEAHDEFLLATELSTGSDGLFDIDQNFLILAVIIVILFNKIENVIYVHFHLLDKLDLEHDVCRYILFDLLDTDAAIDVQIIALIILLIPWRYDLLALELVEGRKYVLKP